MLESVRCGEREREHFLGNWDRKTYPRFSTNFRLISFCAFSVLKFLHPSALGFVALLPSAIPSLLGYFLLNPYCVLSSVLAMALHISPHLIISVSHGSSSVPSQHRVGTALRLPAPRTEGLVLGPHLQVGVCPSCISSQSVGSNNKCCEIFIKLKIYAVTLFTLLLKICYLI